MTNDRNLTGVEFIKGYIHLYSPLVAQQQQKKNNTSESRNNNLTKHK